MSGIGSIENEAGMKATVETEFYSEKEDKRNETVDEYDAVLFTVCDMFGRPRGRFAFGGENIQRFATNGMETSKTTCVLGFHSERPTTLPRYNNTKQCSSLMFPDMSTLRPLSWLCTKDTKIGHVLCDLYDVKGQPDVSSPRAQALKQLSGLKDLGYQVMSSFETEYTVYLKGTLQAYGGDYNEVCGIMRLDTEILFYYDNMMSLLASGIPVETQMEEYGPGQMEYSMKPQYGIKMPDAIHHLRYITKSLCNKNGLEATFMTRPNKDTTSSGFHLNHSLWTLGGKNAFYDPEDDHKCSKIMGHWVAGLLHHGSALAALFCPTINCYERLHDTFAPGDNNWNYNDRNARLRVKTKGSNIYIEDRMPSSACNPYLSIAGLVAAGTDGIRRKLEAPPPRTFRPIQAGTEIAIPKDPLPRSLGEALQALEQDTVLTDALGKEFVQEYISLCKEHQLEKLKDVLDKELGDKFEPQRDLYLRNL